MPFRLPFAWIISKGSAMISQKQAISHLTHGLDTLAIDRPSPEILQQLWRYFSELQKWNVRMNLVAKGPALDLLENHFLDCLTLLPLVNKYMEQGSSRLLDIGSGAGFPGLVVKIAHPDLPVTLVEPRQKRTAFLRHIARTLGLEQLTILEAHIAKEDCEFSTKHGQFSLITCRALTTIGDFLGMIGHIAAPGAKIIFMKGPKAQEEVEDACKSPHPFDYQSTTTFALPFSEATRSLVIFGKNRAVGVPN